MSIEHHDLHHEFPEFKEAIHQLKVSDKHFARLFDEYHTATREVERLEGTGVPVDDSGFEDLKKKRLKLKDALYSMLRSTVG